VHLSALLPVVLALQAVSVLPAGVQTRSAAHHTATMARSVPLRSCRALRDSLLQCKRMAVRCGNPPDNNSRCCRPAQVKVAQSVVRGLLETMEAADFLDLQQKSYMMLNADEEDWRKLKLHPISIKATSGSARRDFSAGE
jgi:hypothetical protein